ncbi:MAG: YebC/PmpR family DNA-binding transcriptional regulator, partial [Chloroflexi bacterium]|nr:YebC/PmpR family DNA-binding transcriptional regulator [Chloroflexota bacterium]
DTMDVITEASDLHKVREAIEAQGITVESAELAAIPKSKVELSEKDSEAALRLFEKLDDLDDVSRVYSNAVISDAILAAAD